MKRLVLHPRQDELYELYEHQRTHARILGALERSYGTCVQYIYLALPFWSQSWIQRTSTLRTEAEPLRRQ